MKLTALIDFYLRPTPAIADPEPRSVDELPFFLQSAAPESVENTNADADVDSSVPRIEYRIDARRCYCCGGLIFARMRFEAVWVCQACHPFPAEPGAYEVAEDGDPS